MTCERNLDLALNKQESKNARVYFGSGLLIMEF
jgi:hypothetical protein